MFTITHFQSRPPEPIKSQILQMVVDHVTDISAVAIAVSNPLYNLYQYGVGHEVHQYLEAMDGSGNLRVELIVATEPQDDTVLGFVLYLPAQDDPQACAVAYMAVKPSHRRQGIARGMLDQMVARYRHAELACFIPKVPYFEAMGFKVLGVRGPQVLMNTQDYRSNGLIAVLDVAPIYRSVEVQQIHTYLLKQHGKKAMVEAEKKRDRHLDELTRHAQAFVRERLGQGSL